MAVSVTFHSIQICDRAYYLGKNFKNTLQNAISAQLSIHSIGQHTMHLFNKLQVVIIVQCLLILQY